MNSVLLIDSQGRQNRVLMDPDDAEGRGNAQPEECISHQPSQSIAQAPQNGDLTQPRPNVTQSNSQVAPTLGNHVANRTDARNSSSNNGPTLKRGLPKSDLDSSSPKKKTKEEKSPNWKKWERSLNQLYEYEKVHGNCLVPRGYTLNPHLGSWVAEQRKQHKLLQDGKASSMTPARMELLNQIGFAWNAQEASWKTHYLDLQQYKKEHGNCLVPLNHEKYPKLGLWVKEQRRHYSLLQQEKRSHMTKERVESLEKLGFCWDTYEASWQERFDELKLFKESYGHCVVPTVFPDNPKLGTWVHHQRRQHKLFRQGKPAHINEQRIRLLDSIGFSWTLKPESKSTK